MSAKKEQTILVVDTEPGLIEAANKAFQGIYEVTIASNLKSAMSKATEEQPSAILVGYLGPRGTSFELNQQLRKEEATKNIPQVIIDVRPEEHSRKGWKRYEGLKLDAEDYISRPVQPTELKQTVQAALKRAQAKPLELAEVVHQMEAILERIDKIERMLVS
jgi:two-component system phosphate regulon response regulator PhoB